MNKHTPTTIQHPIKDLFREYQESYIKAGEHNDGKDYWENFSSVSEMIEDFKWFALFKEGKK